ncbi:MAG: flavodoxin family protein [Curvibacter sp.]|nr:MAG: flavodoxin family protein [Curvibacter sp.]
MKRRILIIQGHPDHRAPHLAHALADAYASGAQLQGHEVRQVCVAQLDLSLIHSQEEWERTPVPAALAAVQEELRWAQHLVFFFPLWLGEMPAMLKGFLEQVARPELVRSPGPQGRSTPGLKGRSARLVVTMGMPALFYSGFYGGHGLRSMRRSVLGFMGISPVRQTLIGRVDSLSPHRFEGLVHQMQLLGRNAR